ncbi:flagellar hook-basal body complex protein [Sporofaciens musculi]|uniref:flagellar hook-basal body complex protein n=1 Tax=Sporofaciens musculi TaxID=2681861 RepID=UPI00256FE5AC|nr:flagellar hook-basal body complex protein [Sporofaciens musculi]
MVRSMVAAVAGLKTHQSKMDVIGNNIANVNTWGFKSYSFNFQDSMYANSISGSGGSSAAGAAGGRNASQVGYGSTLSSITNEFGTGAPSPSSNPLDCMIDGTGFFLVGNMVNGSFTNVADSGLFLSRVGIFRVDNNGYLVDDQRSYVYGYALVEGTGIPEKSAKPSSYAFKNSDMTITTETDAATNVTKNYITIAGLKVETKVAPGDSSKYEDAINDWISGANKDAKFGEYNIAFNGLTSTVDPTDPTKRIFGANLTVTAKKTGDTHTAIEGLGFGNNFTQLELGNELVPGIDAEYSDELSAIRIPIDPDTGLMYEIQSYKINEDGTILGVDKQNRAIAIGQIALVTVENPNGLEKTSGYYYTPGANAGDTTAMKPNGGPSGKIMGGYLEMANVDLANEFSNMITCQRGFQANSKIITVTDEMLSELVNMKR